MTAASVAAVLTGDVIEVARALLGMRVETNIGGTATSVVLTEVEAYAGDRDPASHAHRGETPRNASMFGPPGTLYVYRSYGIHWCANIVVGERGVAHAVLLRGGAPSVGTQTMAERRGRRDHLTDGPGKLCQALGIDGGHDGSSVFDGPVRLLVGALPAGAEVRTTPRIGISKAVDLPWRFVVDLKGSPIS